MLAEEEGFVVRLRALLHDANFPFFCTLSDLCLAFQVTEKRETGLGLIERAQEE